MLRRWGGPIIAFLIVAGVAGVLIMNLEPRRANKPDSPSQRANPPDGLGAGGNAANKAAGKGLPAGFREYPIGEEVERNGLRIAAVWMPSVEVEDQKIVSGSDVIHLEADVHATEGNPNGFALGEFVPYLKISYTIEPAAGGAAISGGDLLPMVARDGLHYGASLSMPKAGHYRLTYHVDPPSAGGLGRHVDRVTGVARWWPPFVAVYDWDYPGPQPRGETTKTTEAP